MLVGVYTDYREYLKNVLETRIQKNARYSLRSFARDLGVAPSNLSLILKGKKGISTESAVKIAALLQLNENESNYFCDLVSLVHARGPAAQKIATLRLNRYKQSLQFEMIREDVFRIISDWYHIAIMELTYAKNFQSDPAWIAKKLKISVHEANQAVDRLVRMKMLTVQKNRLVKTDQHLSTTHEIPSDAIKNFNRQILAKAEQALTYQSLSERDLTTMTFCIDVKKMDEAKKRIKKFRHEMTDFLESGDRTEVYCLAIQLFSLSNPIGDQK